MQRTPNNAPNIRERQQERAQDRHERALPSRDRRVLTSNRLPNLVLVRVGERRTAFLKEWGCVKVLVLVASAHDHEQSALDPAIVVSVGLSGYAPGFVDLDEGRLGCQAFLR